MASNMRTSRAGLDVIKAFEGFRPRYQKLPNGRWIIGYGHLRDEGEGVQISEEEAEAILREYDLPPIERLVMDCVLAPLNQNEFDALVSFAFSIGPKNFVRSDVVSCINSGNRVGAATAFDFWRRAKIGGRVQVLDALVRRRAVEKALFLKAPGDMPAASSRIYVPLHDRVKAQKTLPKPREILVEQAKAEAEPSPDPAPSPPLTAAEEAAASVRRRLVRIIGEDTAELETSETIDDTTDGASPEEITAAISALAGETGTSSVEKSVWPPREDLPPPPFFEAQETSSENERAQRSAPRIDDLEEVKISPDDIERAVQVNERIAAEENGAKWLNALPFGLLSLIGLGFTGFGIIKLFGLGGYRDADSGFEAYLPPFLVLLGGILFITMIYYCIRALIEGRR